jgi:HK97 family phage portal protein
MNLKSIWPFSRKGLSVDMGDGFIRGGGTTLLSPYWSNVAGMRGPSWENSAVMACMGYLVRTMPEAALKVKVTKQDEEETLPSHKLYDLLRRPNVSAGYMWSDIVSAIAVSLSLDGNAYLRVRKNGFSQIGALEYLPFLSCEPKERVQGQGLTHYEVKTGYSFDEVPREEIIHFRFGIDMDNTLKGMSVFKSVVKEVLTDNEAAVYNNAILRNLGVLGFLITPGAGQEFTTEQARALEDKILHQFTGEDRGRPATLKLEANVQTVGQSPDKMQVRDTRKTPEERISAVFGLPAIVAGLGAGLDRSTFANFKEAREAAMESCNAPLWYRIAETLDAFFSDVGLLSAGQFVEFDLSKVRALQEDESDKHDRARKNFQIGIWKRSESRTYTGKQATPEDEIYFTEIQQARADATAQSALLADEARQSSQRAKVLASIDGMVE